MDAHRELTQVHTVALHTERRHPGAVLIVLYTSENILNLDDRSLIREIKSQVMVPMCQFYFRKWPLFQLGSILIKTDMFYQNLLISE